MAIFRAYLIIGFVAIAAYTVHVIVAFGPIFLQVATEMILGFGWPGQFALDFGLYLGLSVFWIMWRNAFSTWGIVFGAIAGILGAFVLLPYLLYLVQQTKGDAKLMLIGPTRM